MSLGPTSNSNPSFWVYK